MGNNEKQIYYREIILNIKKLPFSWKLSEIRKFPEVYKQREVDYNGVKCTLFNGDWTCHKSRLMDYSSNLGEILEINLLESECHISVFNNHVSRFRFDLKLCKKLWWKMENDISVLQRRGSNYSKYIYKTANMRYKIQTCLFLG